MLNKGKGPNRLILAIINFAGFVVINPNTRLGKF
jgi:hypothetical protein